MGGKRLAGLAIACLAIGFPPKIFKRHFIYIYIMSSKKKLEATDNILLYCARLEETIKELRSDYDKMAQRQEKLLEQMKKDREQAKESFSQLFNDFVANFQDLLTPRPVEPPHTKEP